MPTLRELVKAEPDMDFAAMARRNPKEIIEGFFHIVNKSGDRVPFILNKPQNRYHDIMSPRDDILKARQEGFSSLVLAMFTARFLFIPNVRCVCISHEKEATQRLFAKVEYYINNLPFEVDLKKKTSEKMVYSPSKDDVREFYIGTAGSKAFGRGDTIHYLHISELAFWENSARVLNGLMEAVPSDLDRTQIIKECTANGVETLHHREWVQEKAGNSIFKPVFFAWYENPEYRMDATGFEATPEEKTLAVEHDLTFEQLAWRRWKISSMQPEEGLSKEDIFKQEYPATDEEAFISSGNPVFDVEILKRHEKLYVRVPKEKGGFHGWNPPIFYDDKNSNLHIWERPVPNQTYVIGGDVGDAEDFSVLAVYKREIYEMVAQYVGKMDEYELATLAYKLGAFYNNALMGIERNNQGVAVVKKLDELEYKNQYVRKSIDKINKYKMNELGWSTNERTRPIMYTDLLQLLSKDQIIIRDKRTLKELYSIVRGKRGRPAAKKGAHDDTVIATAIAIQLMKDVSVSEEYSIIRSRNYRLNNSLSNFSAVRNGNLRRSSRDSWRRVEGHSQGW